MAEIAEGAGAPVIAEESDFSPRKLKIAFACLVGLMLAGGGFAQGAIALIMAPLQQEFGWSRAAIGGALTAMTWAGALGMPAAGRYADRMGSRPMLLISAVLITVVTAAFSLSTSSLVQFYGCFIMLGLLGATAVGYTKIVSALFTRHRGKAFALFTVEATIVAAFMPQIMKVFFVEYGWRGLFLWLAALKIVVALPILFLMLKDPTEGVLGKARAALGPTPQPMLAVGMTTAEAMRSLPFWMILAANIGGGVTIYGLLPHLVGMMKSKGLGLDAAVGAMSFMSLFIAIGQFASGFVVDRINTPRISAAFLCLFLVGIVMVSRTSAATGAWPLYAGVALMGLGGGAQVPMRNYFFTRYFGLKAFAEITGIFTAIQAFLTAPAPWLIGLVFDQTGSYAFAFVLFMGCAASSIVLLAILPRYRYAAASAAA